VALPSGTLPEYAPSAPAPEYCNVGLDPLDSVDVCAGGTTVDPDCIWQNPGTEAISNAAVQIVNRSDFDLFLFPGGCIVSVLLQQTGRKAVKSHWIRTEAV
jgi:hypothetical protein